MQTPVHANLRKVTRRLPAEATSRRRRTVRHAGAGSERQCLAKRGDRGRVRTSSSRSALLGYGRVLGVSPEPAAAPSTPRAPAGDRGRSAHTRRPLPCVARALARRPNGARLPKTAPRRLSRSLHHGPSHGDPARNARWNGCVSLVARTVRGSCCNPWSRVVDVLSINPGACGTRDARRGGSSVVPHLDIRVLALSSRALLSEGSLERVSSRFDRSRQVHRGAPSSRLDRAGRCEVLPTAACVGPPSTRVATGWARVWNGSGSRGSGGRYVSRNDTAQQRPPPQ